jgi:hypothetical protein
MNLIVGTGLAGGERDAAQVEAPPGPLLRVMQRAARLTGSVTRRERQRRGPGRDVPGCLALGRELDRSLTDLRADGAALRGAAAAYHGSVVSHGVLIGELDERMVRLEQRSEPSEAA